MASPLQAYQQQTSRILHDPGNVNYSVSDLTAYINIARGQIASNSGCVRQLVTVNLTNGQETYGLPAAGNGLGESFAVSVLNISVPWGTYTPTLDRYAFSEFQAYFRLFSGTVSGFPECWSQQGTGQASVVYFFPIPTQTFASLWDCTFSVAPLTGSATDLEALPYPYTDAIPYFAAYLALMNAQRYQEAKAQFGIFQMFMGSSNNSTNPLFVGTQYPGVSGDRSGGP